MESYSSMNRNELLRKLQQHSKYSTLSQKNIGTNKTIHDLRMELQQLDTVTDKALTIEQKIYTIDGIDYTEDALRMMISFYNNHHKKEAKTVNPSLPDDAMKEILYESDINTIVKYCTTNKYNAICNNANFWKIIFERDNIRILSTPTNSKEWIDLYKRTLDAQKEALALETLPRHVTSGVYEFNMKGKYKFKFDTHFNKYAGFLSETGVFYTNMSRNGVMLRSAGHKDKLISKEEFYNLLVDLLYFYPDIYITTDGPNDKQIPLRKKDISPLRNKTGYKTIAKTIINHYEKVDIMAVTYNYDDIRRNFRPSEALRRSY